MKNVKRLLSLILCAVAVMHAQAETNLGFSVAGMQVNDQNCAILNDVLDLPTVRSEKAEKNFTKIVTQNVAIGIKA